MLKVCQDKHWQEKHDTGDIEEQLASHALKSSSGEIINEEHDHDDHSTIIKIKIINHMSPDGKIPSISRDINTQRAVSFNRSFERALSEPLFGIRNLNHEIVIGIEENAVRFIGRISKCDLA